MPTRRPSRFRGPALAAATLIAGPLLLPAAPGTGPASRPAAAATRPARAPAAGPAAAPAAAPTLVTLRLKGATPREAVAAVAARGGLHLAPAAAAALDAAGPADRRLDVDLDRRPFWEALLDVVGRAGVAVRSVAADGTLDLSATNGGVPPAPAAASGPCLLTIARAEVNVNRTREFAVPRPMTTTILFAPVCLLNFYAYAEPRLSGTLWLRDAAEAETDDGKPVARATWDDRPGGVWMNGNDSVALTGDLSAARRLAWVRLRGRLLLPGRLETWEVPNPLGVKEHQGSVCGFRAVIRNVAQVVDGRYTFESSVYRDGRPPSEWRTLQAVLWRYRPKLLSADRKPIEGSPSGSSSGQDEFRSQWTFEAKGGFTPAWLEWKCPADFEEVPVAFEFRDVPLP